MVKNPAGAGFFIKVNRMLMKVGSYYIVLLCKRNPE